MPAIHRNITFQRLVSDAWQFIRSQRMVVGQTGRPFQRSRKYVEMDITYRCNLRCRNCNRSCTQLPSRQDMPTEQVDRFIRESIAADAPWERVRLLGGEPTLHPDFFAILDILRTYRDMHRPGLRIVLCTNGAGGRVRQVLDRLPDDIVIKNTYKSSAPRLFRPFNVAPVDQRRYRFADFSCGCRIISDCGLGVTPLGYYPCAIAGGIDRVFGFGIGRKHLPPPEDELRDQMDVFCRLCGHFGFAWPVKQASMSPVWKRAYQLAGNRGV